MSFSYKIKEDFDHIFDEKANTFLALRKVQWGGKGDYKLDIRKWYVNSDGEEVVGKGVSFLTEEGPDELTKILVEQGYGDTKELMEVLSNRNEEVVEDEIYYDPKDVLL